MFTADKPFRYALINQGFDFTEVDIQNTVPADVDILVLADVRTPLTAEEFLNLKNYVGKGGNLLIAGDIHRQECMNPIVEMFGVKFMAGQLVCPSEFTSPELILSQITQKAYEMSDAFPEGVQVTMPGCLGLDYVQGSEYQIIPLTTTSCSNVWNENETTNFIDEKLEYNPDKGEKQKVYPTSLMLKKNVNDKDQKIVIMGDADCFSNDELSRDRKNIVAYNFTLINGVFCWLSDGKAPIDTSRPLRTDDNIYIGASSTQVARIIFVWLFPGVLLLSYFVIWIRRRTR